MNLKDEELIYNNMITTALVPISSISSNRNKIVLKIEEFLKRTIDIIGSLIGIILLIPITIAIYFANWISKDKGPVFYTQERYGKDGKLFKMYKYRSMVVGADEKLEKYQDEMLELPGEIDRVNFQLMLFTMECCYRTMKENQGAIQEITDWVTQVRIDLKKNLIRRQEMEQQNQEIYSYMHDVFGADVVDLFDMSMLPENSSEK